MRHRFLSVWVTALAFTLVSCGGGLPTERDFIKPVIPKADLVANPTTIRLGEGSTFTPSCAPVSATTSSARSWPSTKGPMDFSSEVVTPTVVGEVKHTFTCTGISGSTTKEVIVTVLPPLPTPNISGRIFSPVAGADLTNTRVYITLGAVTDSADVNTDGTYTLPNRLSTADSVDVLVKDKSQSGIPFHSSLVALHKKDFGKSQDFIRVPRSKTVSKGVFAGTTVPIDLVLAYTPSTPGDFSFYFRVLQQDNRWRYTMACVPKSKMPMPYAFDRGNSNQAIDSVGFSAAIDTMEMVLGQDVFRPANFSDLLPNQGLRVSVDSTIQASGLGGSWLSSSLPYQSVNGGTVVFSSTLLSGATHTVVHEVSHTLAFGHTCSWKTVMNSGCDNSKVPFGETFFPTVTDIAYMEVMWAVCEVGMATSAPYSIPEAFEGLKKERGLAREVIWRP